MPIAKKKEKRGAIWSTVAPALTPHRRYSRPSARVSPSSKPGVAPASCRWYPEMEMELNLGISFETKRTMSPMERIEGSGG